MRLSYRGAKYESTLSLVTTVPGKVIGHYRGVEVREQVIKQPQF